MLIVSLDELSATNLQNKPIHLEIQATEVIIDKLHENESISSISNLIICLKFTNRPPKFKVDQLIGRIEEHSHIGSAVFWHSNDLAHVIDLDQELNGTIKLELVDSGGTFSIEPSLAYRTTYFTLLVNDSFLLDYEKRRNISVMVSEDIIALI